MDTDQAGKFVPGIPLAALDAIEDANVRDVLRALVATHHVRNNVAGSGSESFITTRQALALVAPSATAGAAAPTRLPARYLDGNGGGASFGPGSMSGPLGTLTLNLEVAAEVAATVIWQATPGSNCNTRIELRDGAGAVLLAHSDSVFGPGPATHMARGRLSYPAPGRFGITVHAGNDWTAGSFSLGGWALLLMPVG
jgi:hypothetical protein